MLTHVLAATALLAAGLLPPSVAAAQAAPGAAPEGASRVIVQLRDAGASRAAAAELARDGATVHHRYSHVLTGFAATVPAGRLAALQRDPRVTSVVPDGTAVPDDHVGTPWGLDRTDQRQVPLDGAFAHDTDGRGVTAYVIDSGIRTSHSDFGGRARWGVDLVDGTRTDCTGHGTHVAGTVGGTTYGVAPAVDLVAVRVFGCKADAASSWSTIIAGLDWVVAHRAGPSVVNMSLSGLANQAMDDAVARATAAGVAVVVTAGNDGYDACQKSPARAPSALTVGATQRSDARAAFSNTGPCLDLFAPGVGIPSAAGWDDTGHWLSDGTSMAAAHVSGAVARHLELRPSAGVSELSDLLTSGATPGLVTDSRSTTASLLHLPAVMAPGPAEPTTPSVPQALAAVVTGPSTATATWRSPADDGGSPVTGYAVSGCGLTPRTVGTSPQEVALTELKGGTSCTVSVTAVNAQGSSPTATVVLHVPTAPSAPESVTASANANSVTVSWRPPASSGGAPVLHYTVRIVDTRTNTTYERMPTASAVSVTVPVTSRKREHRVELAAVNIAGAGPTVVRTVTTK